MSKRFIEFIIDGEKKKCFVPNDVPNDKLQHYEALAKAEYLRSLESDTFEASNGKVYKLPQMNKNRVLALLPEIDKDRFIKQDNLIRSLNGKISGAKRRIYGNYKAKQKAELFNETGTYILELLGKGYTAVEVHKKLLGQGYDLEYQTILDYHSKNREKVTELRNQFNAEYSDVSLSNKRSRLEKLNYLLNEIMINFDEANTPKLRESLSKEARGIIDQARREVEGEEVKLTINGRIDIEATLNIAMSDTKMLQGLTIQQMVISRVASRLGLKSQYLIDRLAYGFYSKYNGFRSNADLSTKPIYPTSIVYDIMDPGIEQKHEKWLRKQEIYSDFEMIEEEDDKLLVKDTKEIMRAKLNELIGDAQKIREDSKG